MQVGSIPIGNGQILELHVFEFESEQQMLDAKNIIEQHAQSGSTGPIILPNGDNISGLLPHEVWLLFQLMRANLFLLMFSVIR